MSWRVYPSPLRPSIRFSRTEIRHILLALGVLIVAFGVAFGGGIGGITALPEFFLGTLLLAAIAVPTGFLLHELGHKVVAQRYGCWAEFRAWTYGLFLALLTSFLGLLFAAPGAVRIEGPMTLRQYGRVSGAGPLVNAAIGGPTLAVWFLLLAADVNAPITTGMTVLRLVGVVAFVNLLLGTFNMIPVPPLDGSKVYRWDRRAFAGLLGANVGLLVVAIAFGVLSRA